MVYHTGFFDDQWQCWYYWQRVTVIKLWYYYLIVNNNAAFKFVFILLYIYWIRNKSFENEHEKKEIEKISLWNNKK